MSDRTPHFVRFPVQCSQLRTPHSAFRTLCIGFGFRISAFGFLSAFGFRLSDFRSPHSALPPALAVLLLALAWSARADYVQTFDSGFQSGGLVPDDNKSGWTDTRTLSGVSGAIADVSVTLNLSGGWNGDLYAYVVHNDGFAVLLNRVGRGTANPPGYGDSGMSVVFNEAAAGGDIHWYGGMGEPVGNYLPDGRYILPKSEVGVFDVTTRTALLSSFVGLDPNGKWTLFVADASGGDQSTVTKWGLAIRLASVPEPASLVEGTLAALFLGGAIVLYRLKRPRQA